MTQDDPDSLDRLIDDVARGMTAAPVDDAFARRVSSRLDDPDAGAPRTWPRAWRLAPAAGAVLLALLAISLLRDGNVRLKPDATAVTKPDATGKTTTAQKTATAGAPVASGFSLTAIAVPPADLETIAPIEMSPLDVSPLVTVMPIEIQAIAIDRIEIPPMP